MMFGPTDRCKAQIILFICLMMSAVASAGTRVLVRFDETGHYAHQVHRSISSQSELALAPIDQSTTSSEVLLRWFDTDGELMATTRIIDPRVTHAPLQAGSTEYSWTVLREGAYLVSGPDSASKLEITLPSRNTPAIPSETWIIEFN